MRKASLWEVKFHHKDKKFWGDHKEVHVNAQNVEQATAKAKKIINDKYKIISIEWLATED